MTRVVVHRGGSWLGGAAAGRVEMKMDSSQDLEAFLRGLPVGCRVGVELCIAGWPFGSVEGHEWGGLSGSANGGVSFRDVEWTCAVWQLEQVHVWSL